MARSEGTPAFTLNQLAAFVTVADSGTISEAAQRLHVSPSAVSAAITELERSLHAHLLHRLRAKGVRLTPTGELLLPRARLVLHQALELEADARGTDEGVRGKVRLGCYPSLSPTVLPTIMSGFGNKHPEARLEVREATQDQLAAGFAAGTLDLAVMYDLDLPSSWQRATFAHLRPKVVLPADHQLAAIPGPTDLRELADTPMVLLDAPPSLNHAMWCCRTAGFTPKVAYRAGTYETARAFVGHGFGWTFQLQRPSADVTYDGRPLVMKEIGIPELPPVAVCVVWHPDALLNRASRTFVSYALDRGAEAVPDPQES